MASRRSMRLLALGILLAGALAAAGLWLARERGPKDTVVIREHADAFTELLTRREGESLPAGLLYDAADKVELIRFMDERAELTERDRADRGVVSDPVLYFRRRPHFELAAENPDDPDVTWTVRTNDLGMRNDADVLPERPDLRILVTGDSHADGICDNDQSFTYLLGERLRAERGGVVEALNAALGGYNPYHYLAVLERWADELRPHVFVATVFGGNDFSSMAKFQRYYHRRGTYVANRYTIRELKEARVRVSGYRGQGFISLGYFLANPGEEAIALDTIRTLSLEMRRLANERDIALVLVYLPSPMQGQPHLHAATRKGVREAFELDEEPFAYLDRIADGWMEFLAAEGIAHLDLRPVFRATEEPLYWKGDLHINLRGHELVAAELAPVVSAALE